MNEGIKHTTGNYSTYLEFQQMQPEFKIIPHKVPGKPWEVIGTDLFNININLLCIVDYYRKFPTGDQAEKQ